MTTYYYRVADFLFSVCLPADMDVEKLLPSFHPFRAAGQEEGNRLLFDFTVLTGDRMPEEEPEELLEETDNDMGHLILYAIAEGYLVKIVNGCHTHLMVANRDFSSVKACLKREDINAGNALSSLLRIAYSQAILCHDAISIHAAAVCHDGKAYLFLGASGTGKSTHANLWIRHIPETELLNDDNPTVRITNGKAYAYGTPWSGKTPCYRNQSFPIQGIVRLNQAGANSFCRQEGADAFVAIYPGCSVIAEDERLRHRLYDTIVSLAGRVTVGLLDCLPDKEAALICRQALANDGTQQEAQKNCI